MAHTILNTIVTCLLVFFLVSMFDFYWFDLLVNLLPCLGLWGAYFLLQGVGNDGYLGLLRWTYFTN